MKCPRCGSECGVANPNTLDLTGLTKKERKIANSGKVWGDGCINRFCRAWFLKLDRKLFVFEDGKWIRHDVIKEKVVFT